METRKKRETCAVLHPEVGPKTAPLSKKFEWLAPMSQSSNLPSMQYPVTATFQRPSPAEPPFWRSAAKEKAWERESRV